MEYEERLTCFIDLLGFKSAINKSLDTDWVREELYGTIHQLKSDEFKEELYGTIPHFDFKSKDIRKTSRDAFGEEAASILSPVFPLSITQLSDSYVLSCPAESVSSCALLLKSVYFIHLLYFHNLGMMMRGGIAIGKLIHEENGALFGPAMNEAYILESKKAIYPRVVLSSDAYLHLSSKLKSARELTPFNVAFDGLNIFDLIGIFSWSGDQENKFEYISKRLEDISSDILESDPVAHPKVAYLISELKKLKT